MTQDLTVLRARMLERLASHKTQAGETPAEDGPDYEATASADVPATKEPIQENESAQEPEMLVASFATYANVGANPVIDLQLFQTDESDPHWATFANGAPLAEIHLADQESPEEIRSMFLSATYADTVRRSVAQIGLEETLTSVKARPYAERIKRTDAVEEIRAELRKEHEASLRTKQAEAAQDLLSATGLVLEAAQKNIMVTNPLKTALYQALSSMGVSSPVRTVEAAFEAAAPEFFNAVIEKALEWSSFSPEAYKQVEASVRSANSYVPSERDAQVVPETPQAVEASIPVNVPIQSQRVASDNTKLSRKDQLRQRFFSKE